MRLCVLATLAAGLERGTCGMECAADADCGKCGDEGTGRCSSPASKTQFPAIAASCTSAPADAPQEPQPSIDDSTWPSQWQADAETRTYGDFKTHSPVIAKARYFYDGVLGRERAEWHPYINGKNTTQVWIGGTATTQSKYYVKSGPLCIYFPITDPATKQTVNLQLPDWMPQCGKAGLATYEGREKVDGEWADHYACVMDYEAANQTIAFQSWHSLGLGATPRGMPMRVTGGNSVPSATKGSPRLNTVWYRNFTVGPGSVKPSDFEKPALICIPVGEEEAASFLSSHQQRDHRQHRAHYLPFRQADREDLVRARTKRPRETYQGATLSRAMDRLNAVLTRDEGLVLRRCGEFSVQELQRAQRELYAARSTDLQELYQGDARALPFETVEELEAAHDQQSQALDHEDLKDMVRDGLCHETVMLYVHHLTEAARQELKSGEFVLPTLPTTAHGAPAVDSPVHRAAHVRYADQVSCATCHTVPTSVVV